MAVLMAALVMAAMAVRMAQGPVPRAATMRPLVRTMPMVQTGRAVMQTGHASGSFILRDGA